MHYHLEVILPPVEKPEQAIAQILERFDENGEDEDGDRNSHAFWDFYVIGGRWAGSKLEAMLDQEKLRAFNDELRNRKITVNGLTTGKPTLNPDSQIAVVDAFWNESFPDSPTKICPLFSHFNDQYANSDGFPDIMRLKDMPEELAASRVIVAGPSWKDDGSLAATYMLQDSFWNGVTHVDSKWDGNVRTAIEEYKKQLEGYNPEYAVKVTPTNDWLVITVDYHS